jgi:hypothetical protein
MQFKKLAAITGSVLMAGLALAGPVLATNVTQLKNIGDMVGVTDSTVNFPLFVIGANAATSDVAGAIDVAVNMAANAKTTSTVTVPGAQVGITGGVSMATSSNPLVMWNNMSSSKQTLTANDLPTVLASETYVDANSISTPYSQYLGFPTTNGQVVYDTPNGGTSPSLGMRFTGGATVYNYTLAFTKQLSEASSTAGSVTNMVNTQLSMLGKTWTITAATVNAVKDLALTMLSGKNSQTVTTDAPATYDVDGTPYTVELVAVGTISGAAAATVTVTKEGGASETLQILSGGTKTLSDGTLIGVTSIFVTTKTGAIDSATVFIGADKLELEDTDMTDGAAYPGIKINGETLTDVAVSMSGNSTGTSTTAGTTTLNSIALSWTPSLEQFVTAGNSLTDPASGGFKIFFGGISPAIDDTANRETITVTPSGTAATLGFKTSSGSSLSQNFVRATAASTVELADAGGYALHLLEGEAVGQNQYMVLGQNSLAGVGQNPFGHIIRVLSLQTSAASTSQLQDVASGTTITITGGNTTLYLDGQQYQVCVPTTSAAYFVWGTGATCTGGVDVGSDTYDVYPAIQTSKGAWVSIMNPVNITGLTTGTTYTLNLPTGTLDVVPNATVGTGQGAQTVGTAIYNVTGVADGTWVQVRATDNSANAAWTTPSLLVVEGLDENQARNAVAVRIGGDTPTVRTLIAAAPSFTSTTTATPGVSGTTQNKYVDAFGTYVTYDSTAPGTFSMSYPSSQAQAVVGVGTSPAPSGGSAGGSVTTETVLPITADVVKLDSEVASSDKSGKDLVLVGGPCINSLVAELADAGTFPYSCADWPGSDFGRVQLVSDAFANGYTALVIAGTRAADTDLAARIVQTGMPGATDAQKARDSIEVTGSVSSPAYS